jgi:hypothetical protein
MTTITADTTVAYRIEVRNSAGVLTTPSAVIVTVAKPDATTITVPSTSAGTGLIDLEVTFDAPGYWSVHVQCIAPTVAHRIIESVAA